MTDEQSELHRLRQEVRELQERIARIGHRLDQMEGKAVAESTAVDAPPFVIRTPPSTLPVTPPPIVGELPTLPPTAADAPPILSSPPPVASAPQESFEVRLGTYWLPRIGIAVFLTGMVFFAAWLAPRLTISLKVALGYFVCLILGGLGILLDRKTPQFARVLQAGSLALAYFVTYAAHFVDAFRLIQSPTVAIAMLSVVVLFIIGVAQERQSPTLGGMALFFGYYTSWASGVATFTLASNAILALAAIFFLMRNRWVHISFGAVLMTYLIYMVWIYKFARSIDLDRLILDAGYLSGADFRLRATFLSLYWLVFAAGALIANRDAMTAAERNGLLTLNNVFFFMLFSLLMHHAYPDKQWVFQFCFGGALLVGSALAYQRFAPERSVMDALFLQGVAVATLGLISYFKGVQLIAVLALESVFLLLLSRWMQSRWIAWIGRATFTIAAVYAWDRYDDWDAPLRYGVWCAAAAGFICARLENRTGRDREVAPTFDLSALYFAVVATALGMMAARQEFGSGTLPWVWTFGAVAVAIVGAALRTREILWASHLPLVWAYGAFVSARFDGREWALAPSLVLIAVTFAYGLVMWARARANDDQTQGTNVFTPYEFFAMLATILTTIDSVPNQWRLTAFAAETLVLVVAAALADERTFAWSSLATLIVGVLGYFAISRRTFMTDAAAAWWNFLIAFGLFVITERICKRNTNLTKLGTWVVVALTAVALFTLRKLVGGAYLTVSWAMLGFVLLAFGFTIKQRSYRTAGLVALAFSLLRAVLHDMANVETIYRILSFIGLGIILLVLGFVYAKNREKLAKWL